MSQISVLRRFYPPWSCLKSLPAGYFPVIELPLDLWFQKTIMSGALGYSKTCLGSAVGSVAVGLRAAWLRWSASLGSRPRLARSLCQVITAYALRLNSWAGTEGSTMSSLICDRWLILDSETLSISRCLIEPLITDGLLLHAWPIINGSVHTHR